MSNRARQLYVRIIGGRNAFYSSDIMKRSSGSFRFRRRRESRERCFWRETRKPDWRRAYPVPANYASKSKLVERRYCSNTIAELKPLYTKQIGPIERKGSWVLLVADEKSYRVVAESGPYKVLLASLTTLNQEPGDRSDYRRTERDQVPTGAVKMCQTRGKLAVLWRLLRQAQSSDEQIRRTIK